MGCEVPQTIFGIKIQRVAIIFGFIDLIFHTLRIVIIMNNITDMSDIMHGKSQNQTKVLEEADSIGQATGAAGVNSTRSIIEGIKAFGQLTAGLGVFVLFLGAIYEVFCLSTILILLCSIWKQCLCCTMPWFSMAMFDIFIVVSSLLQKGNDIPQVYFFLLLLQLVCVCFAMFAVMCALYERNEFDVRSAEYSGPPVDTELEITTKPTIKSCSDTENIA